MTTRDFLVFRLAGPMMAFGGIAVGERRSLWDAPSKSGVLGLLAACLGLARTDQPALLRLDQALGFAVRVDDPGRPLRDYHTAQNPTEAALNRRRKAGLAVATRRDELDSDDLNTVLSERLYRVNAAVTVALWVRPGQAYDLGSLAEALRRPVFTPYLGRRACPLGLPPNPRIITASGLSVALAHIPETVTRPGGQARTGAPELWFEWDAGLEAEEEAATALRLRRDGLRHRGLWQFTDRQEGLLPTAPKATEEHA
jgi:CRISPR system Cascade subunit CasD